MKLNRKMTMQDCAFAVAKALDEKGIDVVLTGGAVVSIYSNGKYVSQDLDFLTSDDHGKIKKVMGELGFESKGKDFFHPDSIFSVEFPGSQLVIGEEAMKPEGKISEGKISEGKISEGKFVLKLLSPTQCVLDRLAAFYHWSDRQGLEQALIVASAHPIKLSKVKAWSVGEGMLDRHEIFLSSLKRLKKAR